MPLYEYECSTCGQCDTVLQRLNQEAPERLRTCNMTAGCSIRRKLSAPAVHFKGSGFYETDYKRVENK